MTQSQLRQQDRTEKTELFSFSWIAPKCMRSRLVACVELCTTPYPNRTRVGHVWTDVEARHIPHPSLVYLRASGGCCAGRMGYLCVGECIRVQCCVLIH